MKYAKKLIDELFNDEYYYVVSTVTSVAGTLLAFYLALPASLTNDEHVQAVFTPAPGSQASSVFEIKNNNNPPLIQVNNDLYNLISNKHDLNFQANSSNLIKL